MSYNLSSKMFKILRDRDGRAVGVLCLMRHRGKNYFGLSLKSFDDKFNIYIGKTLAFNRVLAASNKARSEKDYIQRKKALKVIHNMCWDDYLFISDLTSNAVDESYPVKSGEIDGGLTINVNF